MQKDTIRAVHSNYFLVFFKLEDMLPSEALPQFRFSLITSYRSLVQIGADIFSKLNHKDIISVLAAIQSTL